MKLQTIPRKASQRTGFSGLPTKHTIILLIILLGGFWIRLTGLGAVPFGINQDEAYAGYEAWSLLHYGMDSRGYAFPVYFTSWGSGMNALYSYLSIPFIALNQGSLNTFIIRLPQALSACLSLVIFYLLLERLFHSKRTSLIGTFLLAASPWHIMLSRWGLESNIAPAFLLLGLYCFIKGFEHSRWFIGSALFYGLSLYCYAPLWLMLPLILIMMAGYSLYCKALKPDRHFYIALALLFLLAVPLFLFLLINRGILPEIRTGLISIPKMPEYRGGEISPANIKTAVYNLYHLLTTQHDDNIWNSTAEFGLFYKFSLVFILTGLYTTGKKVMRFIRHKEFDPLAFVFFHIIISIVFGLMINNINVNKVNALYIPLLVCCVQGIITVSSWFKRTIIPFIMFAYILSFAGFASYYLNIYNIEAAEAFQYGVEEALDFAMAKTDGTICVTKDIYYPKVLFYTKMPLEQYLETAVYDPAEFSPVSFDRFVFSEAITEAVDPALTYIIHADDKEAFKEQDFATKTFGLYAVAWKE